MRAARFRNDSIDGSGRFSILFAAALRSTTTSSCVDRALIALDGNVIYFLARGSPANEIFGAETVWVSTVGFGLPGSSMTISGNGFSVRGTGIRCCCEGVWIGENRLRSRSERAGGAAAVELVAGEDPRRHRPLRRARNQISGFAAGILVRRAGRRGDR